MADPLYQLLIELEQLAHTKGWDASPPTLHRINHNVSYPDGGYERVEITLLPDVERPVARQLIDLAAKMSETPAPIERGFTGPPLATVAIWETYLAFPETVDPQKAGHLRDDSRTDLLVRWTVAAVNDGMIALVRRQDKDKPDVLNVLPERLGPIAGSLRLFHDEAVHYWQRRALASAES